MSVEINGFSLLTDHAIVGKGSTVLSEKVSLAHRVFPTRFYVFCSKLSSDKIEGAKRKCKEKLCLLFVCFTMIVRSSFASSGYSAATTTPTKTSWVSQRRKILVRIFPMHTGMQREQHESARHTPTTILSFNRRSLIIVFAKEIQRNDRTEGSIEEQGFKQWKLLLLYSLGIVRSTCSKGETRKGRSRTSWMDFRPFSRTLGDAHRSSFRPTLRKNWTVATV